MDAGESADIVLAVAEACNNAIEHGYGGGDGSIEISATHEGGRLTAVVTDGGQWQRPGDGGDRGRGLEIMRALMDVATIDEGSHGTTVTLERELVSAVSA